MRHLYVSHSHSEKHATNWCRIMWCPNRNLVERLRRDGRVERSGGLGEMIWSRVEHDEVALLLDRGETYRCQSCGNGGTLITGTYDSDARKARALAAGR